MIKKLIPDYYYKTIEDIPYNKLYANGIRLILTDLDNTLISYKCTDPTEALISWKNRLTQMGFEIIIVSNSRKHRVEHFARLLELPFVKFAKKPTKFGLKKAIRMASKSYAKAEIMEIGDQVMTDVFASKRLGVLTVLVKAIDKKTEILPTKINRKLEEHFLKRIKRKYPKVYQEKLEEYVRDKHDN